jgi:hypothetical protein
LPVILLDIPSIQQKVTAFTVSQLSKRLNTDVRIENVDIEWLNRFILKNVIIDDPSGERLLEAGNVTVGFKLRSLFRDKWILTTVRLFDVTCHIKRENSHSDTNLQFILDAFAGNSTNESNIELKISSILIRKGRFTYDILDKANNVRHFNPDHLDISNINGALSVKHFSSDSLMAVVNKFSFNEISGLDVRKLSFGISCNRDSLLLHDIALTLPASSISIPTAGIRLNNTDSLPAISGESPLFLKIARSKIAPADFDALTPLPVGFTDIIDASADIGGSIDSLSLDQVIIMYGNKMSLAGGINIKGLADKGNPPYLNGHLSQLNITTDDIQKLIHNFDAIQLPTPVMRLGELHFKGEVAGFIDNLTTQVEISSPIGSVKMDVKTGYSKDTTLFIRGNLTSSSLIISSLFDEGNPFGKARFNADIKLQKTGREALYGTIKTNVNEIEYRGYEYKNISVSGGFRKNRYEGIVHIDDPYGHFDMQGLLINDKDKFEMELIADLDGFRPDTLHLIDNFKHPEIALSLNASFTGSNPDDFDGYIRLKNLSFRTDIDSFAIRDVLIASSSEKPSSEEAQNRRLRITSDVINADLSGRYSLTSLLPDLLTTTRKYLPSLVETYHKDSVPTEKNIFDYHIVINNTEHISNTLKLPVTILEKATIEGRYDNASGKLLSNINIPSFNIGTNKFEKGSIHINNKDGKINLNLNVTHYNKNGLHNALSLKSDAGDDKIGLKLQWSNDKTEKYEAEIDASALFTKDANKDGRADLRTEITVNPTRIVMKDSVWHIDPASATVTDGKINIDNFYITKGEQYLHLNGVISKDPRETFFLDMKDVEISYIFDVLNIPALRFGGLATGAVNGRDLLGSMMIGGRLEVQDFSFNQVVQGKLKLSSEWDSDILAIRLLGSIYKNDSIYTDVDGEIFPVGANQGLSIHFNANEINLAFVQRYMSAFASNVQGLGFGHVLLHGNFSDIFIEGNPYIRDASMKVNILNTSYSFSDTLFLDKYGIGTKQTAVRDRNNNTGILNFMLHHNSFRDLSYELDVNAEKLLVYDIPQTVNPKIYGQVYASGQTHIEGTEDNILVDGNARCEAGTSVGFNFMNDSKVNDYDFISFAEHRQTADGDTTAVINGNGNGHSSMDYQLNFLVNATPSAKIELTIDSDDGDKLRGEGNGNIQISYGSRSDLQLFGNYLITNGTYNFNLQQVVRKRFNIRDGSTVSFRGDPMAAILDINASYNLAANIQDLDETLIMETGTPTIPVNCILKLDGRLQNPDISFDLELPNSNSELERQVKSFIDTEDMMTRQIIYLLVLNKFYTPDYSRNTYTGDEFSAVASSALSSQLSNLLSTLTDKVQIGTNIRSRQDGIKDTEVEMLLSSQLLNNRLLFNGNFGYKDNYIQSNAFVGEFDLEYKLTRTGDISLKAYNHANDLYRYNTKSLTRQGVGLMFRKDFSIFSDIFRRRRTSLVPPPPPKP